MSLVYNWVLDSGIAPVPPCPTVVTESVEERDEPSAMRVTRKGSFKAAANPANV